MLAVEVVVQAEPVEQVEQVVVETVVRQPLEVLQTQIQVVVVGEVQALVLHMLVVLVDQVLLSLKHMQLQTQILQHSHHQGHGLLQQVQHR
jgi:hypothetical protein